jgi:hypothetical protein
MRYEEPEKDEHEHTKTKHIQIGVRHPVGGHAMSKKGVDFVEEENSDRNEDIGENGFI